MLVYVLAAGLHRCRVEVMAAETAEQVKRELVVMEVMMVKVMVMVQEIVVLKVMIVV